MAVVIVGNGSHARDIIATLTPRPANDALHCVESHTLYEPRDRDSVIIAINDPQLRHQVALALGLPVPDITWIHPDARIYNCTIANAGTHINYGVTMTRTTIGHHCTISPGVTICGDVTIGNRVLVGAGATICDRVTIGSDVTIGAGCVVLPESVVPDGSTIVGVPAKHVATGVHVK